MFVNFFIACNGFIKLFLNVLKQNIKRWKYKQKVKQLMLNNIESIISEAIQYVYVSEKYFVFRNDKVKRHCKSKDIKEKIKIPIRYF